MPLNILLLGRCCELGLYMSGGRFIQSDRVWISHIQAAWWPWSGRKWLPTHSLEAHSVGRFVRAIPVIPALHTT